MDMFDIAMFHSAFNIGTTVIMLAGHKVLIKLCELSVPIVEEPTHPELIPVVWDTIALSHPTVAINGAFEAVVKMAELAKLLCASALDIMLINDAADFDLAQKREKLLDKLEVEASDYLKRVAISSKVSEKDSAAITMLLTSIIDFERIGDYSIDIIERAGEVVDKGIVFSDSATDEMKNLNVIANEILDLTITVLKHCRDKNFNVKTAYAIEPLEEVIDDIHEVLHERHIQRLKDNKCSIESGVVFLEVLTAYERIGDHCSNVATAIISMVTNEPNRHKIRQKMTSGKNYEFNIQKSEYNNKYRKLFNM